MSVTTVQIPAEHIEPIREGLLGRRDQLDHAAAGSQIGEVERLIEQLEAGAGAAAGPCALTGPREVLWAAVYDAVCAAAERLADDCNELWRGTVDPAQTRTAIQALANRFELLESLGAPPGD